MDMRNAIKAAGKMAYGLMRDHKEEIGTAYLTDKGANIGIRIKIDAGDAPNSKKVTARIRFHPTEVVDEDERTVDDPQMSLPGTE